MNPNDLSVCPHCYMNRSFLVVRVIGVSDERLDTSVESLEHLLELREHYVSVNGTIRPERQMFIGKRASTESPGVISDAVEESTMDLA
jgi:hypothetical protein